MASTERGRFIDEMRRKIEELTRKMEEMDRGASRVSADARSRYEKEKIDLAYKRDEIKRRLERLQAAGEDAWEDVKAGAEKAWSSLRDSVDRAAAHFRR